MEIGIGISIAALIGYVVLMVTLYLIKRDNIQQNKKSPK